MAWSSTRHRLATTSRVPARWKARCSPNTPSPDVMLPNYCVSRPDIKMPCTTGASRQKAARSRHPTGVNASLCDGSVRFVSNNVALNVWQAASTINGAENVGGDF